jgi:hypothetical protein
MLRTYNVITRAKRAILTDAGTENLFEARVFEDLVFITKEIVERQ